MAFFRLLLLSTTIVALTGCAKEVFPPEMPGYYTGQAPARPAVTRSAYGLAAEQPRYTMLPRRGLRSLDIPDGEACLSELDRQGIAYRTLNDRPGMTTPVVVTGPVAGIRYLTEGQPRLVCDCRLVAALAEVAPELRAFGITEIRHSGAYVFRNTRTGKPSLHARGLAIDVHELLTRTDDFVVKRDYAVGRGASCSPDSPVVNRLACVFERTGLFKEVLTPDDDYDHRDHVHLAIRPLAVQ